MSDKLYITVSDHIAHISRKPYISDNPNITKEIPDDLADKIRGAISSFKESLNLVGETKITSVDIDWKKTPAKNNGKE